MTRERIEAGLPAAFEGFPESSAMGHGYYRGKVRDVVLGKDSLLLVASDRISAFDRVIGTVPFKGEILSRLASFWFAKTADIVANHHIAGPGEFPGTGRACLARRARMLPLEVVVRGFLTGSAWRDYSANRPVSGIRLPEGLCQNEKFPVPILTPSTKEASGHDRAISREEILAEGLLEKGTWEEIERISLALFRRGQEIASSVGLLLVDTKYEFGIVDGKLCLCDEIHTPDSSRWWWSDSYQARFAAGEAQKELDKEPFRRWLAQRGVTGQGEPPSIPAEIRIETAQRYVQAFETLTGEFFVSLSGDPQAELAVLERIVAERLR